MISINWKWNKRTMYKDWRGYLRYRDSNKLVHRYIAEKKLNRKLKPWEVVHHINRDKVDNHPSNLWVFRNQKDHHRAHLKDFRRYGRF